jgi:putative ABC transport system permease protein
MATSGLRFWLVWSWRDLRRRWPLVVAIGLLLAGGTGLAAGLGSMRDWRVDSNDRSFGALSVHDLRVEVEEGSFVPAGSLRSAAFEIPASDGIAATSERLIAPTQIDATEAAPQSVLTPGQLVGVEGPPARMVDGVEMTGPAVDAISVDRGRGLPAGSAAAPVALLDTSYGEANEIEVPGPIRLAGGAELEAVGLGRSPETFVVLGPGGAFSSEQGFGVVFAPLATAQRLSGRRGKVNDLVLTLEPDADRAVVAEQLRGELERSLPGVGVAITTREDIDAHRILYDDAENDQQLFNVFAFLILAGAGFGAFNLISRTIEAQRREIGIGMALGVPPQRLAVRPLLLGLQIGVMGVVLGVGVGLLVNEWLRSLLEDQLPLPILETGFRFSTFVSRAAIGLVIPILAAAWPVRRGLRVTPIEAIRVGFRAARGGGLAPLLGRLPLPGSTLAQMPPRNVLRAPRRTALTVLASAAVVSVAVSMSGLLDSFAATVDRNQAEELSAAPKRLTVSLDRFYPERAGQVAAVAASDAVAESDRRLSVPAELRSGTEQIETVVETVPARGAVWTPRAAEGRLPQGPDDLGLGIGDQVALIHPLRVGPDRFATEETTLRVSGLHPDPFRFPSFVSPGAARSFGLAGRANDLEVVPPRGVSEAEAKRVLFGIGGVASIESASALGEALDEGLDEFAAIVTVVTVIALALVLLIAFNSTAINADERAREHATMFAYGLPVRTVLRMSMIESLIMGLFATLLGIALGVGILNWVVSVNLEEVLPELGAVVSLSMGSVLLAALAGIGAMGTAPLLSVRRLRRMDVPSTLRVME